VWYPAKKIEKSLKEHLTDMRKRDTVKDHAKIMMLVK